MKIVIELNPKEVNLEVYLNPNGRLDKELRGKGVSTQVLLVDDNGNITHEKTNMHVDVRISHNELYYKEGEENA